MEVYRRETQEVIKRFLAHRLTFPATMCALDAALAAHLQEMTSEEIPVLRLMVIANAAFITKEMKRRADVV